MKRLPHTVCALRICLLVADHDDGAYLNSYDWGNCRTNGWHLLGGSPVWYTAVSHGGGRDAVARGTSFSTV